LTRPPPRRLVRAEGIGIGPETRFTGKINKVPLEVSPIK
jgi:hypothetical protein